MRVVWNSRRVYAPDPSGSLDHLENLTRVPIQYVVGAPGA